MTRHASKSFITLLPNRSDYHVPLQDFSGNYANADNTMYISSQKNKNMGDITTGLEIMGESSSSACKRRSLLIFEDNASAAPDSVETAGTLEYPNQG